jgi:hypothetical protein
LYICPACNAGSARALSGHLYNPRRRSLSLSVILEKYKVVGKSNSKTVVPVPVFRVVPVAVGAARIPLIVVERTAAQQALQPG